MSEKKKGFIIDDVMDYDPDCRIDIPSLVGKKLYKHIHFHIIDLGVVFRSGNIIRLYPFDKLKYCPDCKKEVIAISMRTSLEKESSKEEKKATA